ncbi:hypothetical protein [Actinoplanes sp. NPDC049118]|uniref:hypothetical protein n=1 Tax=Actinoplanes sp. NPDC049118 TaxID=3155769 RepID=UPI0033DE4594
MSIDGQWHIVIRSALGKQEATAQFESDGSRLVGKVDAGGGRINDIEDGAIDGDLLRFKVPMSTMPITLSFEVTRDGDTLAGHAKAGAFGKVKVAGTRV